jgi:hypothetical protein
MKAESESTELNAVVLASAKSSFFMVGECATVFNPTKPGAVSPAHGFTSGVSALSFAPGGFIRAWCASVFSKCINTKISLHSPVITGRVLFGVAM